MHYEVFDPRDGIPFYVTRSLWLAWLLAWLFKGDYDSV